MEYKNGLTTITGTPGQIAAVAIEALGIQDPVTLEIIPPALETVQAWAAGFVNTYAGELRTKIGTDIPFQGDVYQLKETEAKSFATDNSPDATKYPVMFAEAAARQMQPADVAAEYLYNSQAWPVLLAQIEGLRLGSLAKLQMATTVKEIETILAGLE